MKRLAFSYPDRAATWQSVLDAATAAKSTDAGAGHLFQCRGIRIGARRRPRHTHRRMRQKGFWRRRGSARPRDPALAGRIQSRPRHPGRLFGHSVAVCRRGCSKPLPSTFILALLPKFGGKGFYGLNVHKAVLAAGETESGATVHYVDAGTDTGQIIRQTRVPVEPGDTPETLAARVLEAEHRLLPEVVADLCREKAN